MEIRRVIARPACLDRFVCFDLSRAKESSGRRTKASSLASISILNTFAESFHLRRHAMASDPTRLGLFDWRAFTEKQLPIPHPVAVPGCPYCRDEPYQGRRSSPVTFTRQPLRLHAHLPRQLQHES